jgi:predicted anti-sigma-YlaC factor YlaD
MMTCRECAELLLEFLAGDLDAVNCELIRQHLERCPPCVAYVETYQITIQMTRQLTCVQLPPEFAERLWKAMQECEEEQE